jgi:hypothetical protein
MPHLLQLEGQRPGGKCLVYALQREICHEFWALVERTHPFGYHTKQFLAISVVSSVVEDRRSLYLVSNARPIAGLGWKCTGGSCVGHDCSVLKRLICPSRIKHNNSLRVGIIGSGS